MKTGSQQDSSLAVVSQLTGFRIVHVCCCTLTEVASRVRAPVTSLPPLRRYPHSGRVSSGNRREGFLVSIEPPTPLPAKLSLCPWDVRMRESVSPGASATHPDLLIAPPATGLHGPLQNRHPRAMQPSAKS
ncbi:hypothetical protein CB1_000273057 [Camelus ferus]|nr:hypothetical protein CB1_000273057 [Camelus ferus]